MMKQAQATDQKMSSLSVSRASRTPWRKRVLAITLLALAGSGLAQAHFTLQFTVWNREAGLPYYQGSTVWVDPGQPLTLQCRIINDSDIRGLSSISGRDSALGDLEFPADLSIPPGGQYTHRFDFVAQEELQCVTHDLRFSAWSTNGIVHTRSTTFCLRPREPSAFVDLDTAALREEDAGTSYWVHCYVREGPDGNTNIHTSAVRWQLVEIGETAIQEDGSPPPDGEVSYLARAPAVSGRFQRRIFFTVWDRFGNTATSETSYTVVVPGDNFDPDGDGMHNEYEVANGLNPLVPDSLGDPDRDGHNNLAESLFGTRARNFASRPMVDVNVLIPGTIEVCWQSVPGHVYRLERRLDQQSWVKIHSMTATQTESCARVPIVGSGAIFRVEASKP